ncbi:hypothetical protein [Haloferax sp. YSSS75]|uniref:hypothetical protein n=1 Tax=Haloferax sp. YSSS75 TaxID=3388564 RepID=UPI00398CA018
MTNLGEDTQAAMCYPKQTQYEQWKDWASEMGYKSVSRFMIEMVEAGYKQLNISIGYDDDTKELRKQRNDLKRELDQTRDRLQQLEDQLYRDERNSILEFLEEEPNGATFAEIVQHVINDTPARVSIILNELDSDQIRLEDGRYDVRGAQDDG